MPERQHATWGELLREAVEKPGRMLEAYTAFHNFSLGNALLALEQCIRRNLQPGPLNTYNGWLERKRQVRKGEKGIILCMPMACKRNAQTEAVPNETAEPQTCYAFRFRAYWFVLAQTEGEDTPIPPIPGFDVDRALCALNITRTPFDEINGNIQGFASGREIAVHPLAALPHKTTEELPDLVHSSGTSRESLRHRGFVAKSRRYLAAVLTSYGAKYILCCKPISATRAIAVAKGRAERASFRSALATASKNV